MKVNQRGDQIWGEIGRGASEERERHVPVATRARTCRNGESRPGNRREKRRDGADLRIEGEIGREKSGINADHRHVAEIAITADPYQSFLVRG